MCRQVCGCILQFENAWEEKEIELETDMEDSAFVEADESLLELVWNNLISNAVKFTPPGGTITVKQFSRQDTVTVSVSDTGCGMDAESMMMLLITSLASSVFVVIVASVFLRRLNSETVTCNRKVSISGQHAWGSLYAMYRRDLRRYVSSRVYITNTAIGMLLLVVLSYLMGYSDSLGSSDGLGQIMPYLASYLPFFVSFFIGTSSTTAVSLSMEGLTRWILGTAPLRPWDIFLSKILVNLTLIVPMEFLSIGILATGMGVSGFDLVLLIAVPTAYALFIPALGMAMNVRYPRYDWSSEYYAVKGGSVSMLGSMGIGLVSVIVPLIVSGMSPSPDFVIGVTAGIVLILTTLMYLHLRKIGLYFY